MPNPGQELSSIDFESMLGGPLGAVVNAQAQAALTSVNFIKQVGFEAPPDVQDETNQGVGRPIYVTFKYPKEVAPYEPASDGAVMSSSVTAAGTGYTEGTHSVSLDGGGGTGATGDITVDSNGSVTGVSITAVGSGYTADFTHSVTVGGGSAATLQVVVDEVRSSVAAKFQEMKLEVPILTILPIPFIRIESTTIDFNAKINSVEYTKTDTTLKVDASLDVKASYGNFLSPWKGSARLKVSTSYQRNSQTGTNVQRTYSMGVSIRAVQDEMPAGMERILGILEDAIKAQPTNAPVPVEV